MADFAHYAKITKPLDVVTVEPYFFASTWPKRPTTPIAVGLRALSEDDCRSAEIQARRRAEDSDNPTEAYNHELLCFAVARGICDPNDAGKPAPLLDYPEDTVPRAFTPAGLRYLFDQIERAIVASSPLYLEASDEEIAGFSGRLRELLPRLSEAKQARVRRFVAFALADLNDHSAD